jgi:multiple sugar transport system permease protein
VSTSVPLEPGLVVVPAVVPEIPTPRVPAGRHRRRRFLRWLATHSLLVLLAVMFLAPIAFVALTALMSNEQALSSDLWPHPFEWSNFTTVFHTMPLWRYTFNTMLYAVGSVIGMLVSSVPAGYALARLRFRGRQLAFVLVLAALVVPAQVIVVPQYVMFAKLHLVGTLWPLILPNFLGDAFSIFLLRQFFLTIPEEYADAARVDGASEWQVMTRVILPLAKPAIAATALFNFLYAWNDFFGPLLYTSESRQNWTLSLGLSNFRTLYQVQWNLTMAATLIVMVPVIILFFLAQRTFVEGVTLTGVKG